MFVIFISFQNSISYTFLNYLLYSDVTKNGKYLIVNEILYFYTLSTTVVIIEYFVCDIFSKIWNNI